MKSELHEAMDLANRRLDDVHADPDSDLSMMCRQFLRARERIEFLDKQHEKLMRVVDAFRRQETTDHREWDHSAGCPACDATRDLEVALTALDEKK